MGLCLPGPDGCYTGSFGAENSFVGPSWPGPDFPLGRHEYLGQMLASNKKNKNQLKRLLELWPDTSPTFSSHMAAVNAGIQLLDSKHEFDLLSGEFMYLKINFHPLILALLIFSVTADE